MQRVIESKGAQERQHELLLQRGPSLKLSEAGKMRKYDTCLSLSKTPSGEGVRDMGVHTMDTCVPQDVALACSTSEISERHMNSKKRLWRSGP